MLTMRYFESSYCEKQQSWSEQISSKRGFITMRSFDKTGKQKVKLQK